MKRPSFQFYPADWRKDAALQSCSLAAQGLWINVMCIAHECEPYGHLTVNGKAMTPAQIARLVGLNERDARKLLAELADAGVTSQTENGTIFSRRMLRDEATREKRANGGQEGAEHGIKGASHGSKGGRPKKDKGAPETPLGGEVRGVLEPPNEPPPSSSSSSSPSGITEAIASSSEPAGSDPPKQRGRSVPDCPHQDILALWAEVLPELPQHNPNRWTGDRAASLRARWRETAVEKGWATQAEGLTYFRALFGWMRSSDFLMGRIAPKEGRQRFFAELEWVITPKYWNRVVEGKYRDDEREGAPA